MSVLSPPDRQRGLFVSVLVGVGVSLLLSFVPLSTVLGGLAAGYLRGGGQTSGAVAGALTGLVAFVPFLLLLYLVLAVIAFVGAPSLFGSLAIVLVIGVGLYTVGGGAVGGLAGSYLAGELGQRRPSSA